MNAEKKRLLEELGKLNPTTEEYTITIKNYLTFCEAESKKSLKDDLLPIIISGVFTVFEIVMILKFERFDIISSKSLAFVRKLF